MKIYFTGLNLRFIQFVREVIAFQEKEEEVVLLPNQYVGDFELLYYDPGEKKFYKVENVKEHLF